MTNLNLLAKPWDLARRHWPFIGLMLLVLLLVLAGYSIWQRTPAAPAATATATAPPYSRICVAGVSYLQFPSGASVEWTPAGKVKTCSEAAK